MKKPEMGYTAVQYPEISYNAESDTLRISNGQPAPVERDITKGILKIFFAPDGVAPTAVVLSDALELLAPHLNGDLPGTKEATSFACHQGLDGQSLEISYDDESDILWLGNGRPGSAGFDIAYGILIAFFDSSDGAPVGVMLEDAAELLRPHLPLVRAKAVQGVDATPFPM